MRRKAFIKKSMLAGLGVQFLLNAEVFKNLTVEEIDVKHLLGLDPSHLKSKTILLEAETYDSFSKMKSSAAKEGIEIQIASGYRSFDRQKAIWERKFKQLTQSKSSTEAISEIITYSSIPGTSRHHWGTDIDIIDAAETAPKGGFLLERNYQQDGAFSKLKSWMDVNSDNFGFHLVYTNNDDRTGFNYEPWHYSFAPKSKLFLELQLQQAYKSAWEDLEFEGKSDMSTSFISSYFKNYGTGINPDLMPS